MGGSDPEVMQAAGPAQGDPATAIDQVVAEPEGARRTPPGRVRLRSRPVGLGRGDPPDGPVRSLLVVGEPEGVELRLQLAEGPGCGSLPEPALEGLVEAFDLALGPGMAGRPVLLADGEVREQGLEGVASPGEARRVDRAVVGERGGGPAVGVAGRAERGHDIVVADPPKGPAAEQVAGVVVEPRADLDLAPIGQAPVGDVGLPQLVGRRGLEAQPRAAWALVRLRRDQPRGMEDAPDGRGRWDRPALALEMPGDHDRAGIEPSGGELGA